MAELAIQRNTIKLHNDITAEDVAKVVFQFTTGVPRFVTYALEYLAQISKKNGMVSKNDITSKDFFGDLFRYVNNTERGRAELSQWEHLTKEYQNLYLQLVIDAILAIPYTVEDLISVDALNIEGISLLQIIWAVGIYTAKSPQYEVRPVACVRRKTNTFFR